MAKLFSAGTASNLKTSTRRLAVDILLSLFALGILACTGLAFLVPWLPAFPTGGLALARYIPIYDGDAWLGEQITAATSAQAFRSENFQVLAHERALTSELRLAAIDELRKFVLKPGETTLDDSQFTSRISSMQIILEEDRNLAADGKVDQSSTAILRTASGDYQLASYFPAKNSDLVFDPPILLRPANLRPGAKWQADGTLGSYQYHSSGSIAEATTYQGAKGSFNDCRKITLRLSIAQQGQVANDTTYIDWFCSGTGQVAEQELDANGKLLTRTEMVNSSRFANPSGQPSAASTAPALPLLDPAAQAAATMTTDPAGWVLNVLGRTRTANDTTEATIQPVWVPTDPPLLLVAGHSGDLLALDITQAPGQVLWHYHPNGTIYSQPTFDPARQQIYFGDSGKQLVALDGRGLFRWSYACGDNIVTWPLVVSDTLVFGSEDRNVYALDTRSGALRWKYTTGAAVAGSPAVDGDIVMIGSDDGVVYAFKAASGEKVWTFTTGQAVEAPLVAEDGVVYIASRDMNLYALRAADGSQVWQNPVGNILRTQPAVGKNAVYLIDENGHTSAVSKSDGRRLWTSVERDYEGAPLLVGQTLLAAANGGLIYRLSEDGKRLSAASGAKAFASLQDQDIDFRLGLANGGGAAWMVDSKGYIWRFGPAWSAAQPLELAWSTTLTNPPFKSSPFYSAPQVWNSQFFVADQAGSVYQIDPATGQAALKGSLKDQPGNFRSGLVVGSDYLLASSSNILYAVHLPDIKPLWQFTANGFGLMPAEVNGNRVVWVTGGNDNQAFLNLIDLKSGKQIWEAKLDGVPVPGNALIRDGIVYVNSPISAYQLDTGQKVWQAPTESSIGIGLSVLSPDGETLYSQLTDTQNHPNRVAAIATRNGSPRWVANLGADGLSLVGALSLDGDTLIVPLNNATRPILALDSTTGKEIWRYTPDVPRLGNPFINRGLILFTLENGQEVAVDLKTGREVGRMGLTQASLEGYNFTQAMAVSGEYALAPAGWSLLEIKIPAGLRR
jgi:outer membrane protein assembly factor BamB